MLGTFGHIVRHNGFFGLYSGVREDRVEGIRDNLRLEIRKPADQVLIDFSTIALCRHSTPNDIFNNSIRYI